eukprot:402004_1
MTLILSIFIFVTFYSHTNVQALCYGSGISWATYPYMVALRYTSGDHCCSGSIISLNPPVILTAAQCNVCTGTVRIGCNNPLNCDGDQYSIQQFIQHPNYGSPLQFSNDFAIVPLTEPITTSGAQVINIASIEPSTGNSRITGYGVTQSGSIPTTLQTTTSNKIERQLCQDIVASVQGGGTYVDNSMVCVRGGNAGQENVPGDCVGDAGAPMVSGNAIYGVMSWSLVGSGQGCNSCASCTGYPQVGANVAAGNKWINGYL